MKPEIKEKIVLLVLGVFIGIILASGCYAFSSHFNRPDERPRIELRREMRKETKDKRRIPNIKESQRKGMSDERQFPKQNETQEKR